MRLLQIMQIGFLALATMFGIGKIKIAPGTMGSLAAMLLAFLIQPFMPQIVFWGVIIILFCAGSYGAYLHELKYNKHDDKSVVVDEWVGLWICYGFFAPTLFNLCVGFLLFRFFDILKPWPIRWVDQKWQGAIGTMMDDVLAGLAAAAILALYYFLNLSF